MEIINAKESINDILFNLFDKLMELEDNFKEKNNITL